MKKKLLLVILIIPLLVTVGCTKKESNLKVVVESSSWSGWSEDYKPAKETNEYPVELNKEYSFEGGDFSFKITKVKSDKITIKTNQPMSDNEKGVNLNAQETEFTIKLDKSVELTTPTMDAGYIYTISLKES